MEIKDVTDETLRSAMEIGRDAFDDFNEEDFERMAKDNNYKFFVAQEMGEVLGFVIFLHIDDKLEIIKIATRRSARRKGVAETLIEAMVDYGRVYGHSGIILEVNEKNIPAKSLYEKMGFTSIYVRKRYYDAKDDAIIMELLFNQ